MNKASLRKQLLLKRNSLEKRQVIALSSKISSVFLSQSFFQNCKKLLIYLNFGNEADTREIINSCDKESKQVFLPFTEVEDNRFEIRPFNGWENLVKGKFGISYPKQSGCNFSEANIDLVILPGIAFNKLGNRIGFGGGFYDQLLAENKVNKVALAYEFQVVEEKLPIEKHDVHVDWIITEKRIINCKEQRRGGL